MRAIILAAGVGSRLFGDDRKQPPKALMVFDGQTLLERHIRLLQELGVDGLTLVVGYRKEELVEEARRHSPDGFLDVVENPMYRGGPVISLWTARETLRSGEPVLLMDADVLYHRALLERVVNADPGTVLAFDSAIDDGEDPVRICLRDGMVVEFGKQVIGNFDQIGEWPGFMRMSPDIAGHVADACEAYIENGRLDATYELAIRDVLIGQQPGAFAVVDVSDVPWVEIDFPEDLERAKKEILPQVRESNVVSIDGYSRREGGSG